MVPVCAQQSEPAVRGVERVNLSTGGLGVYRPEMWGAVKISLRNPQDSEVNLLAATHFLGDPTLQYGRRLWMPPQSRMVIWHPIRMPPLPMRASTLGELDPGEGKFFELRSQVMSTEGGTETLAISESGALHFDQSLLIASDEVTTAVIAKPGVEESGRVPSANPQDLILTSRYERGLTHNLVMLNDEQATAAEESLGALDHLVIYDDRLVNDLARITSIRRWVTGGGKLWIMADQVSPELLNALLGEQSSLNVISRAELMHVKVESALGASASAPFERDLDQPVTLVRVVADGFSPAFMCDGWPAALWKSCGNGRILVTTLGADGWLRPRLDRDPDPDRGSSFRTWFFPEQPLNILAAEFFVHHPAPCLPAGIAEETVQGMIGYRVPSRGLVIGALMSFTGLIVVVGLWLARRGRLERLGLAIPVFSLVTAGLLVFTGMKTRAEIPHATSVVQMVQAVPGTDDVHITGTVGVFTRDDSNVVTPQGAWGGWSVPEMKGLEGTTRRLVWSDLDKWSWEKLTRKPGLRTVSFQASGHVNRPLRATATFADGMWGGTLQLPEGVTPSDAILATSAGRIGLTIEPNGRWTISQEQLGVDQFLAATVLSDEQQRRTRLLSQILAPVAGLAPPVIPTIYAWTAPWPEAISVGDPAAAGSAVVAVPLEWQPLPAGAQLTIPRVLLTYREILGPDGNRPSGFFDPRSRQWLERSGPNSGWVAFDVPAELLPLQTRQVEVTFKVTGPVGRLELSGYRDGQLHSIQVWNHPVGTLQHTVTDRSLMPIDSTGRLFFRVDAGVEAEVESIHESDALSEDEMFIKTAPKTYWQFEDISVRITAEVPQVSGATAITTPE